MKKSDKIDDSNLISDIQLNTFLNDDTRTHHSNELIPEESKKIINELQLQKLEIQMQNDELRKIQLELEKSQSRYFDLYEMAPCGYITINQDNDVLESNTAAALMFGTTKFQLEISNLLKYIHFEDIEPYNKSKELALKSGNSQSENIRLSERYSNPTWVKIHINVTNSGELDEIIYRIALTNITQEKKFENIKDTLQEELYHRSRNNMQVISSFINLQARYSDSIEAKNILYSTSDRVNSMAKLYDLLYDIESNTTVCSSHCLKSLALELGVQLSAINQNVKVMTCIDKIILSSQTCTSLGMIIHECLTNAFRHAFPDKRSGTVTVSLFMSEPNMVILSIADNGVAMNMVPVENSLGMKIIHLLSEQVEGTLKFKINNGLTVELHFPTK
ncbi:MAG: PAS domain S-box protein [Proteobacteria bacterium]|nr:PAS domain S-box protein [Pseudomonadota bacterium]